MAEAQLLKEGVEPREGEFLLALPQDKPPFCGLLTIPQYLQRVGGQWDSLVLF